MGQFPKGSVLHRPLPFILVSFGLGLITGEIYDLNRGFISLLCLLSLAILLIHILKRKTPIFFLPLLIFFLLGIQTISQALHPKLPENHISRFITENKVAIMGTVTRSPLYLPDKVRLFVSVEKLRSKDKFLSATGLMALSVREYEGRITLGDRIGFITRIYPIRNFNNPGAFDYRRYMESEGIWVRGYVGSEERIIRLGKGDVNPWSRLVEIFRVRTKAFLEGELKSPALQVYKALIIGEKAGIDKGMRDDFNRAGVGHILAISGLHMGIIALIAFSLLRRLMLLSERLTLSFNVLKLAALISIGPVILYAFVSGLAVSTLRATIMIFALYACILLPRQRDIYNTMALAAFVILIISPASIFNVSFQLSFASVFFIVYLSSLLLSVLSKKSEDIPQKTLPGYRQRILKLMILSLVVSAAAVVGTAPIVAYHFNQITLAGILANLIIIPLIGFVALPLGLLSAGTLPISNGLAELLIHTGGLIIQVSLPIIKFFSNLPLGSFRVSTPTQPEVLLFYSLIFLLFNLKRWRWAKYALPMIILLLLSDQAYYHVRNQYRSGLKAVFLDVGQGSSALVQFPKGKTMLIDGGGFPGSQFDVGEGVVARFLWHQKIKNIDYVVLSHPQADHLNGLPFLAENFNVREYWSNGQSVDTERYRYLMEIIEKKGIARPTLEELRVVRDINGVKVRVIYPPEDFMNDTWRSLNNNSLVLQICCGNDCFLFPGDIESEAEDELTELDRGMKSTVLLVPHHGSSSSSSLDFLEVVRPEIAVFSMGSINRFGFPHREVITRYERLGTQIYRTDQDGAITITTDGNNLEIQKFLNDR